MQGANTQQDAALFSRNFEFISHGLHMTFELLRHGRIAPYVPIGISDIFRWRGEEKRPGSIAIMSRKGSEFCDAVVDALGTDVVFNVIQNATEHKVAETLKQSDMFVAISPAEAFGLPPLEAMCAGCCVVGFPGDGGFEFMRHGETAHLVVNRDKAALLAAVRYVLSSDRYRDGLRKRAMELSGYYTLDREREYLLRALRLTHD